LARAPEGKRQEQLGLGSAEQRVESLTLGLRAALVPFADAGPSDPRQLALELELDDGQVLRLLQAPPEVAGGTERPGI